MVARFGIAKQTHDSIFSAFFFKEKAVHINPIENYQRGQRESWFVWELIFCGNSKECIAVETYFV